jgi:hypothetical protein
MQYQVIRATDCVSMAQELKLRMRDLSFVALYRVYFVSTNNILM